jgi:hypothetical protein
MGNTVFYLSRFTSVQFEAELLVTKLVLEEYLPVTTMRPAPDAAPNWLRVKEKI